MPSRNVKTQVSRLLEEHGIKKPPVPVEAIARARGAEIRYLPFDGDISGMVFRDNDRAVAFGP